jgi:hypothetical protein
VTFRAVEGPAWAWLALTADSGEGDEKRVAAVRAIVACELDRLATDAEERGRSYTPRELSLRAGELREAGGSGG